MFKSPAVKKENHFFAKCHENEYEEVKEDKYFPDIIDNDKQEDTPNLVSDVIPHKLPDLSNKYRKFLKDSSSDEFEPKQSPFEIAENYEYDQKLYVMKDMEVDKNDNHDMYSNNVNRSRSMLNRFNTNYNTTDSRRNSK